MSPRVPVNIDPRFVPHAQEANLRTLRAGYLAVWLSLLACCFEALIAIPGWAAVLVVFIKTNNARRGGAPTILVAVFGLLTSICYLIVSVTFTSGIGFGPGLIIALAAVVVTTRCLLFWAVLEFLEYLLFALGMKEESESVRSTRMLTWPIVLIGGILAFLGWTGRDTAPAAIIGTAIYAILSFLFCGLLALFKMNQAIEYCHASAVGMRRDEDTEGE